jgi:hypothetical protein
VRPTDRDTNVEPITLGTRVVLNVYEPASFHDLWKESRFRATFVGQDRRLWKLLLRYRASVQDRTYTHVCVLPAHPALPIVISQAENRVACFFLTSSGAPSAWAIGNLSLDHDEAP